MIRIDDDQRRARLARRHALAPEARVDSPEAAARAMTCLHATEPASVHLAAWARGDADRADVDRALYTDRSLVKQLAMRRTVFAFPTDLLPAVWGSAAARVATTERARVAKDIELAGVATDGARWVARTLRAVLDRLADGPLTTTELRAEIPALETRVQMGTPGKKWSQVNPIAPRVLTALAASGEIVRGENAGGWKTSRPRWTRREQWLPDAPPPTTTEQGYAALVARWLMTFGPGSEDDIVWWLGSTKSAVRQALVDVGAVPVQTSTGPAWLAADDLDPVEPVEPWAALLPSLDPTTMGWKERGFYLGPHKQKLFDSVGNGGPSAWWDGRIVGGWTHHPETGDVVVVPAEPLDPAVVRALDAEAARLTEWLAGERVQTVYLSPLGRAYAP